MAASALEATIECTGGKTRKNIKIEAESFYVLDGDKVRRFVASAWHIQLIDQEHGNLVCEQTGV